MIRPTIMASIVSFLALQGAPALANEPACQLQNTLEVSITIEDSKDLTEVRDHPYGKVDLNLSLQAKMSMLHFTRREFSLTDGPIQLTDLTQDINRV